MSAALVEDVDIITDTAVKNIIAAAAVKCVIAFIAVNSIVAVACENEVISAACGYLISAVIGYDNIVTSCTAQLVVLICAVYSIGEGIIHH